MAKLSRNDILKIRYQIYRDLGYSGKEASKLRNRKFDVTGINVKDKEVIKGNNYKKVLKNKKADEFGNYAKSIPNDTVLSQWGMLTTDDRYRHETHEYVNFVRRDLKISNNQAYYFVYTMLQYGLTYEEAKDQLLSSKEFEMYRNARVKSSKKTKKGKK